MIRRTLRIIIIGGTQRLEEAPVRRGHGVAEVRQQRGERGVRVADAEERVQRRQQRRHGAARAGERLRFGVLAALVHRVAHAEHEGPQAGIEEVRVAQRAVVLGRLRRVGAREHERQRLARDAPEARLDGPQRRADGGDRRRSRRDLSFSRRRRRSASEGAVAVADGAHRVRGVRLDDEVRLEEPLLVEEPREASEHPNVLGRVRRGRPVSSSEGGGPTTAGVDELPVVEDAARIIERRSPVESLRDRPHAPRETRRKDLDDDDPLPRGRRRRRTARRHRTARRWPPSPRRGAPWGRRLRSSSSIIS
mmetsp:Transcript_8288/g.34139  ORF Transcript_8288/g.34139 Transcript_8288/m.34139 type:complete len:307 (+) Transcript_8288:1137-2057(+)